MLLREKRTLCSSLKELRPIRSFSRIFLTAHFSETEPQLNCVKTSDKQMKTAWASAKELCCGKLLLLLLLLDEWFLRNSFGEVKVQEQLVDFQLNPTIWDICVSN